MHSEKELQEIMDILESMNYDKVMETLMRVELLVAEKQNKTVISECEHVQ
jgi:hypothetical protein